MPHLGSMPYTCLRCTRRLVSTRIALRRNGPATPTIQARDLRTRPTNNLLIVKHLSVAPQPHPLRQHLPSAPPKDLIPEDKLTEEERQLLAEQEGKASPASADAKKLHPQFPRPNEPHLYLDTLAPTDSQLRAAHAFFASGNPRYLFTCATFRQFPADSPAPEVAFLGRSNVGKSSLLNALFGRRSRGSNDSHDRGVAKVSNRAGKTRTMNVFLVGQGVEGGVSAAPTDMHGKPIKGAEGQRWIGPGSAVAVVDMPGHGHGSKEEWGKEIVKYLTKRKQLRRAFLLVDADHGIKENDLAVMRILAEAGVPHQIVLSKADKLVAPKLRSSSKEKVKHGLNILKKRQDKVVEYLKELQDARQGQPPIGEILAVSSMKSVRFDPLEKTDKIGINGLRWAILQAAGLEEV